MDRTGLLLVASTLKGSARGKCPAMRINTAVIRVHVHFLCRLMIPSLRSNGVPPPLPAAPVTDLVHAIIENETGWAPEHKMARSNRVLLLGLCLAFALASAVLADDANSNADAAAAAPAEAAKPADATAEAPKAGSDSSTAAADAQADPKAARAAKMDEERKRFAKMTPEERAAEREAKKKERCFPPSLLIFFPTKRRSKCPPSVLAEVCACATGIAAGRR